MPNPLEMTNEMLLSEAPVDEPVDSGASDDLTIAFEDFDNPELPPEARADALKLLIELVQ